MSLLDFHCPSWFYCGCNNILTTNILRPHMPFEIHFIFVILILLFIFFTHPDLRSDHQTIWCMPCGSLADCHLRTARIISISFLFNLDSMRGAVIPTLRHRQRIGVGDGVSGCAGISVSGHCFDRFKSLSARNVEFCDLRAHFISKYETKQSSYVGRWSHNAHDMCACVCRYSFA